SNSSLVAIAVGLERRESPLRIWSTNFTWLSVNYFSGASVAAVIVTYTNSQDIKALFGTLIIILPLLVVSYLTFRTAMGRVEDTTHHFDQLNRLYLSTIETLAMAIDAKDQVTHGHIRRVQLQAIQLAHEIGVSDENLLKAIEAAALLHDMGKLAVPEHILNKPGKLTDSEFEKMKLHASVGADILSAIDFPYPVVPIVRHHHESWNGSGYPTGLQGTDIPIGARILAVVDCFDALTSDRPYRARLSDEAALAILKDRRGTMYDPMIVDAFCRLHGGLQSEHPSSYPQPTALPSISWQTSTQTNDQTPHYGPASSMADEMLAIYDLTRALAGIGSLQDCGEAFGRHLQQLIPSSLCAFYVHDATRCDLELAHAVGEASSYVKGLRIAIGQRLSGWVAANRQTIVNSDAALDLAELTRARPMSVVLQSCLSTALVADGQLIGVLSLYSHEVEPFTEEHKRMLESVAGHIAYALKHAPEISGTARPDPVTALPHVEQLEGVLQTIFQGHAAGTTSHAIVAIDVSDLKEINEEHGRAAGDLVLRSVAQQIRGSLRTADILFRNTADGFLAFLGTTDPVRADTLAATMRERLQHSSFVVAPGISLVPQI